MKLTAKGVILFTSGALVGLGVAWNLLPVPVPKSVAQMEADAGLDRIVNAQFRSLPFEQAIQDLSNQSHAAIEIRWSALEAAGVDRNAPISLWLNGVKLRLALDRTLSLAGGSTAKLTSYADNNLLIVTTDEDASKQILTCVYDVADLINLTPAEFRKYYGLMPRLIDLTGPPTAIEEDDQREMLTRNIRDIVAPASWRDSGGTEASIHSYNHCLIVTQSLVNHAEIERVLDQMHQVLKRERK